MTALDTRDNVDVDVDLTADVPCSVVDGCNRSATWLLIVTHDAPPEVCGSLPCCEHHRRAINQRITTAIIFGERITCVSHKVDVHASWRPL